MHDPLRALWRFHAGAGARVASRNGIVGICAIVVVLGSAPDPLILLHHIAVGLAGATAGSGPLLALAGIAWGLARDAVPRLTLGLGGWARSLPADGVRHRRGVVGGLAVVQLPLVAALLVAALLTAAVYRVPLSPAKLLGAPLALVAAGAVAVPARRRLAAAPLAAAAAVLAALGRWPALAAAVLAFALSDRVAGPLRLAGGGDVVVAPAGPRSPRIFRFTWRAVGWRLLVPLPLALFALVAAWFYTRNNELEGAALGLVARPWSIIAVAAYVGGLGDVLATRRPAWPWLRSLPLSSRARAVDDAIALGAPALGVVLAAAAVDARSALVALAALPPLAVLGAAGLPGARRRLMRVSGRLLAVGIALGIASAFRPWAALAALAATPLLVRLAARNARREIVTGWKELYHDAAGDTLAWSAR